MFPKSLENKIGAIEAALAKNPEFQSSSKGINLIFGTKSTECDEILVVSLTEGIPAVSLSKSTKALFVLSARPDDWAEFLEAIPKAPFQSYWGILRTFAKEPGVKVLGDVGAFVKYPRIWRLFLEIVRSVVNDAVESNGEVEDVGDEEESTIVGRYVWTSTSLWGKSNVFCEYAGDGPQDVLFLHTAGSDSRQYHALMNNKSLQQKCTMYAFDLPGHGRSELGTKQLVDRLTCTEDAYVGTIKQVIQKLKLRRPIVCGASMAGQVCLAVALRAAELGVSGVVPCEGCEHLPSYPAIYGYTDVNESILNPETVCGMMSPTAPEKHKRLVWWGYSSQGIGVFKGDLAFYFQGWDGRGRMGQIDTKVCPVYMLTGEYDYSCTPATSKATAEQIPGAIFETMKGMGHFPATEDPDAFLPYFTKAIDHIQNSQQSGK